MLENAFRADRNISIAKLARILKVSGSLVRKWLKEHDLSTAFSNLTDDELDHLIKRFRLNRPDSGQSYAIGFVRSKKHKVQRRRVLAAMQRVNPLGVLLRKKKKIVRRDYTAKRPNSMRHMDGYHKLIRYGVVVHGFIDGNSRLVRLHS